MVCGPQEIRRKNISRMKDLLMNCKTWVSYEKLANHFMFHNGASKYKTKEYFDIVVSMCKDMFDFKYDKSGNISEFRREISERDIKWAIIEKEELEQKLSLINNQIKNLEESQKSQEQK